MQLTQVRNATMIIDYAGKKFLIDPVLAEKGAYPGFPGTPGSQRRNPLVELPLPLERLLAVDAVIVTHLHSDHWDEAARRLLPKDITIFAQNAADAAALGKAGFTRARALESEGVFAGIQLSLTGGQHGHSDIYGGAASPGNPALAEDLGQVSGLVFRHPDEKTLYLAGDTVWNDQVAAAIKTHAPEAIIVNAGWAHFEGYQGIIMGCADVLNVHRAAPAAVIVATHMEALNHCLLSRAELRDFAARQGFAPSLRIPADGESLSF